MLKVKRDGKVAVLVSPGYGAGWSTWNTEYAEQLIFNPKLVELVEAGRQAEITNDLVKELLNLTEDESVYVGGASDLQIEWIPEGTVFWIDEYDGSESLHTDHSTYVA